MAVLKKQALDANYGITEFTVAKSTTDSFKIKEKITVETSGNGSKMFK